MEIRNDEPMSVALMLAIHCGDMDALSALLSEHPGLAAAQIRDGRGETRCSLHLAVDWPGYFPNGPAVVRLLIDAGADPNAAVTGSWHAETPLHGAASNDDVEVAAALIDGGADIEATGASIAGGTPLDNAVAYGCWHVARLLVERGARVERLWHAAALGMTERVEALLAVEPPPPPEEINDAFWQACHGGQRRMAEYLLARGADINAVPDHNRSTPLDIAGSPDTRRGILVSWLREQGARCANESALASTEVG
ncbi:MAG: ankyrin repeat domain-containing protein [Streptosporangiaceae bacterium]